MRIRPLAWVLFICVTVAPAFGFSRVLLVGDSIGTGYGVEDRLSFARLLADGLREKLPALRLVNLSQNGLTSQSAATQIEQFLRFAGTPEIFVLEVGGNDFRTEVAPDVVRQNLITILTAVRKQHPKTKLVVVGVGFPGDLKSPYRAAAENLGALCVENFIWTRPEEKTRRQEDGVHPNAEGHREMAEAVLVHLR